MSKIVRRSLVMAAIVSGVWSAMISPSRAQNISDRKIAQLFYPQVSEQATLRVIGKGRASQPADRASLQFKFISNIPFESPPEGVLSQFDTPGEPLSEESLQPIVDALVAIGVPANAIEVKIVEPTGSILPFPFPSTATEGGAEVAVMVEQPTRDRLDQIVDTASDAANNLEDILLSTINVQYAVDDCQALERAAYQSAVEDSQNRARAIAEAMGADLRGAPSVAEPFYGIFLPGCNSEGNLPFGGSAATPYDPNSPVEVEVTKEIFTSYPVR
ncbi:MULTISPECIES: SIMPL domain-containing protein [unclassified Coleofasciculus]|uniref:SIMPL domain-containing protein n=1 Tax=unclassified Coleofasciculus TaxID=2692782 RepID=UPI001880A06E|nr:MULTISPECIES: SIMPL domain-containing protein [unclassified Coleofasciculus]MBE9126331.1 SIMPL domain-containing protein [Coleofasciculus sp. LEGE 07081]MBE9147492.1 SIMPL domain-containing protein [Coleofasciculus sp. LEGE 07092]